MDKTMAAMVREAMAMDEKIDRVDVDARAVDPRRQRQRVVDRLVE